MMTHEESSNWNRSEFNPGSLDKVIIAKPLQDKINSGDYAVLKVIIDLNFNYDEGREEAKEKVIKMIKVFRNRKKYQNVPEQDLKVYHNKTDLSSQYVFAALPAKLIAELIRVDSETLPAAIYKIWPDFEVSAQITKSVSTIKADAARYSFSALGEYIIWAVADSGIDFEHIHFDKHKNKDPHSTYHIDMVDDSDPFLDEFGHGTHVAGIIAGEVDPTQPVTDINDSKTIESQELFALISSRDSDEKTIYESMKLDKISGIAPRCKLVSLKVLDSDGKGEASSLIAAIGHIQKINNYGRDIKIHGLNLSLGYVFEPEWFACGQSPLCVEVDRLVKSGVVVVAAAGNTGYGFVSTAFNDRRAMGIPLSINDPGNAELAITVGSTHRDMPHTFGVSYFSSKGPTGDGRLKPDLVAPGEKIISCISGPKKQTLENEAHGGDFQYMQDSGTSMAAPHVSGAIAAFLSIRREYIGQPEKIKEIFNSTATDLKRDRYFQGNGLLDLMRAIQSI